VFLTKHADILTGLCENVAPYLQSGHSSTEPAKAARPDCSDRIGVSASGSVPGSSSSSSQPKIFSPLNVGIENSRRFRALPVYAVLRNQGKAGLERIFADQVRLARAIVTAILNEPFYELLPREDCLSAEKIVNTHIVVLFTTAKAHQEHAKSLTKMLNDTGKIYVTGTVWNDEPAVRLAVSNWMVNVEEDTKIVTDVLHEVAAAVTLEHESVEA
jgi:glutamate/tyrosine decarboxylase-like PLP-dependent enzyme